MSQLRTSDDSLLCEVSGMYLGSDVWNSRIPDLLSDVQEPAWIQSYVHELICCKMDKKIEELPPESFGEMFVSMRLD